MTDWEAIKTEYITTEISYRQLAGKFGVAEGTLNARAKREGWVEQKQQYRILAQGKLLAQLSDQAAQRVGRYLQVTDKLLDKVELLAEREENLTAANLKTLSDVLKNIKEAQMIRSPRDLQEQDARIEKLRKEVGQKDSADTEIRVELEAVKEFAT